MKLIKQLVVYVIVNQTALFKTKLKGELNPDLNNNNHWNIYYGQTTSVLSTKNGIYQRIIIDWAITMIEKTNVNDLKLQLLM